MRKIALIVPSFPKHSETFIASKFVGLLERGWDVHVVCGESSASEWERFPEIRGLRGRVHRNWPPRPYWLAGTSLPFAFSRSMQQAPRLSLRYLRDGGRRFGPAIVKRYYLDAVLLSLAPDLVHFEFGSLAAERMYLRSLLGCKVVVSFRGYDLSYAGMENPAYYRDVWQEADALHFLSDSLWQQARRRGCPPDRRHVRIPPAIDAHFFDPGNRRHADVAGSRERPIRILSVGRLDWVKGYEYALQAVRDLVNRGVECSYTIIGGGPHLEAVSFARHQLGLEAHVHLVGAQARREVAKAMAEADVLLHAAVSEGFCNVVLEAQAMKLPVVCSDAGGLTENVIDGTTGFIVPRRNAQAMAEKLALLAGDPALRRLLGSAGRERVVRDFDLRNQVQRFDELYREVLRTESPIRVSAG